MSATPTFAINPCFFSTDRAFCFLIDLCHKAFTWLPERFKAIPSRLEQFFRLLVRKANKEGFIEVKREDLLYGFNVESERTITSYINLASYLGLIFTQRSKKGYRIWLLFNKWLGISEEEAQKIAIPLPATLRPAAPRPQKTPIPQLTPQIDVKNPEIAALEEEILHPTVEAQSSDKPKSNVVYVEKVSKFSPEICLEYATYLQARRHGTDREIKDVSNYARWMIEEGLKDSEIERWLIKQGRIKPESSASSNSQRTSNPATNSQPSNNQQPRPPAKEKPRPDKIGSKEDKMNFQDFDKIGKEADRRWNAIDEKLREQMIKDVQASLLGGPLAVIYHGMDAQGFRKCAAEIAWSSVRENVMREWGIPLAEKAREVAK